MSKRSRRNHGVVQLLQFQGTTRSREIFVGFGPPTRRQLSFSRGITSEKVEPCTDPRPKFHPAYVGIGDGTASLGGGVKL